VDLALSGFNHAAASRGAFVWDLAQMESLVPLLDHLPAERRVAVEGALGDFRSVCGPLSPALRRAVIHGDMNDQNVIVDDGGSSVRRYVCADDPWRGELRVGQAWGRCGAGVGWV
jgi:Ser/Thr protein kinase RdoA (MazF antagonist)